jgi:IS30 family transposase
VFSVLSPISGIGPPERSWSARALSPAEREEFSRGLVAGRSLRAIAAELGRAPLIVSQKVARGGGWERYRARPSDPAAWEGASRLKPCKLASYPVLRRTVGAKLSRSWSPE